MTRVSFASTWLGPWCARNHVCIRWHGGKPTIMRNALHVDYPPVASRHVAAVERPPEEYNEPARGNGGVTTRVSSAAPARPTPGRDHCTQAHPHTCTPLHALSFSFSCSIPTPLPPPQPPSPHLPHPFQHPPAFPPNVNHGFRRLCCGPARDRSPHRRRRLDAVVDVCGAPVASGHPHRS